MTDATSQRRWFSFTWRKVFLFVTLVCIWLGWNANRVYEREQMMRDLRARGAVFGSTRRTANAA